MILKVHAMAMYSNLAKRDLKHEHVVPGYAIFINSFQLVVGHHWVHSKHFELFWFSVFWLERWYADLNQRVVYWDANPRPNMVQTYVCLREIFRSRRFGTLWSSSILNCILLYPLKPLYLFCIDTSPSSSLLGSLSLVCVMFICILGLDMGWQKGGYLEGPGL